MTEQDCYEEARREIRRMQETATQQSLVSSYTPLLEVEDTVTTPDGQFVINGIDWDFNPAQVVQTLSVRKKML